MTRMMSEKALQNGIIFIFIKDEIIISQQVNYQISAEKGDTLFYDELIDLAF